MLLAFELIVIASSIGVIIATLQEMHHIKNELKKEAKNNDCSR
jgi:hypothetical protein